jgi:hypothetical protein
VSGSVAGGVVVAVAVGVVGVGVVVGGVVVGVALGLTDALAEAGLLGVRVAPLGRLAARDVGLLCDGVVPADGVSSVVADVGTTFGLLAVSEPAFDILIAMARPTAITNSISTIPPSTF